MTRLVAVALAALLLAPAAGAKTLRVRWVEHKQVGDGGAFVFKVTRIDVTPTRWSAAVSVENRSGAAYDVYAGCTGFAPQAASPGLGIVYYAGGMGWKAGTWARGATAVSPAFPRRFRPHDRWAGTIGGRGALPRKTDLHVSFGFFAPAGDEVAACHMPLAERATSGGQWYWITDHGFRA